MRIVALHTIHVAFVDGMVVRQMKFSFDVEMTTIACRRIAARIDDELTCAATGFDMLAAWAMAGLAPRRAKHLS